MTELACAVCDRRRDGDHQLERPEMTSSGEPAVVRVLDQRARDCHDHLRRVPVSPRVCGDSALLREIDLLLSRVEVTFSPGMEIDLRFTMERLRQPVATRGSGFCLSRPF
jgi:hypothetical protein